MEPKQWNKGGGQQIMSAGERSMRSPMEEPLLRMERWVRQAALGREVVPEVNWMLIVSVGERCWGGSGEEVAPSERTEL